MNAFLSILNIAAPLLPMTIGGLASEYAGRMALFLDGAANLGAFLCYTFTVFTGSPVTGTLLAVLGVAALVFILERLATRLKANMFLAALAMNILFSSLTTLLSSIIFGTRGVLFSEAFVFNPAAARGITSAVCLCVSAAIVFFLAFTIPGLELRISGSEAGVLEARGISADKYRYASWVLAGVCASLCGSCLAIRIDSYVPGISSGRGWTALAAVFLGRKNAVFAALCVLLFAFAEYLSANIQNIPAFAQFPSSILLALPYILAVILILVIPGKKDRQ